MSFDYIDRIQDRFAVMSSLALVCCTLLTMGIGLWVGG